MIWMSVFIKGTFAKVGAENGTQEVRRKLHPLPVSRPIWFRRNSRKRKLCFLGDIGAELIESIEL